MSRRSGSELNSSLSQLLKSDVEYLNSDLTLEAIDQVSSLNPVDRAPGDHLQHVVISESRGRSKDQILPHRHNLCSQLYNMDNIEYKRGFDFNQFIHPISPDHLLTLFNLVRGLTTNTISLGLDIRLMHTDIPSPFVPMPMPSRLSNPALHLPPMLQPTLLQESNPSITRKLMFSLFRGSKITLSLLLVPRPRFTDLLNAGTGSND